MARLPWYAIFFAVVSATLSLLVILSGVAGSAPFFFLQFNTQNYRAPSGGSQLSNSQFLQDLSTVSGNDLVGPSSGQAAHLADLYQVALLTSCQVDNGHTSCSVPRFGYTFEVEQTFYLKNEMFADTDMSAFSKQTDAYRHISLFLAIGYVIGAVFTLSSLALMLLSACFPKGASLMACISQTLAAIFLLATSIAAAVTFYRLGDVFNATLGKNGIQTAVSWRIMVVSFVASVQSWAALIFLLGFRKSAARRRHGSASLSPLHRNVASQPPMGVANKVFVAGSGEASPSSGPNARSSGYRGGAALGYGLLNKIPTWKRTQQRYTEIEKQPGATGRSATTAYSARGGLMAAHEHEEEEDFSHGMPDDVAQGAMGYNPRDPTARYDDPTPAALEIKKTGIHADTAYDPYRK